MLRGCASPRKETMKDQEVVVYFDDKDGKHPNCAWIYHHKPDPEISETPYGKQFGFWLEDDDNPNKRKFVESHAKQLYLMDYDQFVDTWIPDKKNMRTYESIDEFMGEVVLNNL